MDRLFLFVAGAALLAGQVSWSRLASVPIGGSLASGVITLSAAMAGLGLGAFYAGRARIRLLVPACAALLAAMPYLILHVPGDSLLLRRVLTAGLLLAAHLPFGMILPCLAGAKPAASYALSALGSAIGALALSEVLAPQAGYDTIGYLLAAAVLVTGLPLRAAPAPRREVDRAPRKTLALAALLGFLGLLAESLWLQLFGFYWEANAETFGLVVAASIGGIAVGSAYGRRLPLWSAAAALGLAALLSPIALQAYSYGERLAVAALLVGLPAVGFGAAFAQLLERESFPRVAAANAAGAAAAPLLLTLTSTWVGWPARALVGVACAYGLLGGRRSYAVVLFLLVVPGEPSMSAYLPGELPFVRSGVEGTVAVTRDPDSGVDVLWIDRGFQGDTSPPGRAIPAALGRVPVELLGRAPRRALAIGLGTGLTLRGMLDAGAREVEVAELSRGVIEADRTILAGANGRVLERAGVTLRHEDGRTRLADAREPYDLIVTDMMFPTVAGAGNLYSREFYALARSRLTDDGLFVHWLPGFLLAPEDLAAAAAAFLESFPDGTLRIGCGDPDRLVLGLAGGRAPGSDHLLLNTAQLRRLAGDAVPLRDADPRLEIRSNRRGVVFGQAHLDALSLRQ